MPRTDTKRFSMMAMIERVCFRKGLYVLVQQARQMDMEQGGSVGEGL